MWYPSCDERNRMALCASPVAAPPLVDRTTARRVLRWTFTRDDEALTCRLGLTADHSAYELRIDPPWNAVGVAVELFDDAVSAFQRHGAIERTLIADGWSLEAFEWGGA